MKPQVFSQPIALKTRSRKYQKEKVKKQKLLKMLLFMICEAPRKISTIFWPFLAIFTLFHLKNWPYLQKPEFGNLAKTRFWLLQVNNSLCSIPLSWTRSEIKEIPGDRCVQQTTLAWLHSRPCHLHVNSGVKHRDFLQGLYPDLSPRMHGTLCDTGLYLHIPHRAP